MRLTPALLLLTLAAAPRCTAAQAPATAPVAAPAPAATSSAAALPGFEVATIKPIEPGKRSASGIAGFLSYPGGRVLLGSVNLSILLYFAYKKANIEILVIDHIERPSEN